MFLSFRMAWHLRWNLLWASEKFFVKCQAIFIQIYRIKLLEHRHRWPTSETFFRCITFRTTSSLTPQFWIITCFLPRQVLLNFQACRQNSSIINSATNYFGVMLRKCLYTCTRNLQFINLSNRSSSFKVLLHVFHVTESWGNFARNFARKQKCVQNFLPENRFVISALKLYDNFTRKCLNWD